MSPDDKFYAMVGVLAVAVMLQVLLHYVFKRFFGIDMVVEFYAAQAEFTAFWYDRKEEKDARNADRRRALERHPSKRKN